MRGRHALGGILWTLLLAATLAPSTRAEEAYPARPVRIITDSAPGSAIDVVARIVADRLTQMWGQQALVANQPGAGGSIAARVAAQAAPDGYTLFIPALSTFVAPPGAAANLPLQVPRDFAPIGYFGGAPMFITAGSWVGIRTLPELIALAKKSPKELAYGTNGPGRLTHLTGELLAMRAGIKLLMVPYSGGTAQAITDIMGKRIALAIDAYAAFAGAFEAKNVVPLAVASATRLPNFPDVPTASETLPGFEAGGWQVLVAPSGTPEPIIRKLNADLMAAMSHPETRKQLQRFHRDERPYSPAETQAFIQAQQKTWAPVLHQIEAGAK